MFPLIDIVDAATGGGLPLQAPLQVILRSLQGAGGLFVAIKSVWLGITWRRGHEHGTDEFTGIGIAAALIVGAEAIGQAVSAGAGASLAPLPTLPLNTLVGDMVGAVLYLQAVMGPAIVAWRRLRGHKHDAE